MHATYAASAGLCIRLKTGDAWQLLTMQTKIIPICHRAFFLFLTPLLLLVPAVVQGQNPLGTLVHTELAIPLHNAHLQSLLNTAVWNGLPGVSLRVKGPGIDFLGAAGMADLMTGEPLSTSHVMYVASLGKTFTATVALQLCDEGKLDLDAPITTWLPAELTKRIQSSGKITLRHLLSHTSGLIDYLNDDKGWRIDFASNPDRQWTHSDIVPYLFDKPLIFEPGTGYHYSNSNYILVGWILERVTGQPLHALIREYILEPLGLKHTFNGQETVTSKNRAHGYVRRHGRIIDTYPWYGHYGLADSGMHSTTGDLARFLKSIFTSEEILGKTMRTEMTKVSKSGSTLPRYGMGIFVQRDPRGAGRWYTHDGIDPGYRADMMYLPDLDLAVVLTANASLGKADFIYEKLITAVLQVAFTAARENRRQDRCNVREGQPAIRRSAAGISGDINPRHRRANMFSAALESARCELPAVFPGGGIHPRFIRPLQRTYPQLQQKSVRDRLHKSTN